MFSSINWKHRHVFQVPSLLWRLVFFSFVLVFVVVVVGGVLLHHLFMALNLWCPLCRALDAINNSMDEIWNNKAAANGNIRISIYISQCYSLGSRNFCVRTYYMPFNIFQIASVFLLWPMIYFFMFRNWMEDICTRARLLVKAFEAHSLAVIS